MNYNSGTIEAKGIRTAAQQPHAHRKKQDCWCENHYTDTNE